MKTYRILLNEKQGCGFSELEVTNILQQVLQQLAQLHIQGELHGAIAPDTLLHDMQTGDTLLAESTGLSAPTYLPVGQFSVTSPAEDLYALTATMIVLLTDRSLEQLRQANGVWNWEDDVLVSDQFAAVLNCAIAPQPHLRFTSAVEMLQALNSQSVNSPITLTQATHLPVFPPQTSPWKYGMISVGTIIIAGLAGFGILKLITPDSTQTSPVIVSSPSNSPTTQSKPLTSSSIVGGNTLIAPSPQQTSSVETVKNALQTQAASTPSPEPIMTTSEQVGFADGATGTRITGNVTESQRKRYLLNCGKGQQFALRINQGDVNVQIIRPDGQTLGTAASSQASWQGSLSATGDYTVEVSAMSPSSYSISVDVL